MADAETASSASTMSSLMGAMSSIKDKWDSSGGNQVLSNVSSSIPQGTKDYWSTTSKQLFNREHLRGITVFFGIGEERPFYVERVPTLMAERLRHNVSFFYLNYLLITAVLFFLTLLISPSAIIGIGLLALAWVYVIRNTQEGALKVYGISISQKIATAIMGVITVVVLLYLLSNIFWWTLFSSGFMVGVHAILRDASMHKDEDDKVVMSGDLTLDQVDQEQASFLNGGGDAV